jgi:hypothetical protein
MTDEDLNRLNRQGLIAGPGETEEEFKRRVDYCLSLNETMAENFSEEVPFAKQNSRLAAPILKESFELTKKLYDVKPDWIPCFFSNYHLAPWHGGCAWIFQKSDDTPMGAFLQLRKALFRKSVYFGFYKRKELVAHELCHAARMMFEEPEFEEMLAYRTSSASFQKYLGSIARSSIEAMVFFLAVFLIVLIDIMVLVSGYEHLLEPLMWLKLIPLAMVAYAGMRLWKSGRTFRRCFKNLRKTLGASDPANAVIYRLTDEEVAKFSKMPADDILAFAKEERNKEVRWKQIYEYFRRC